MLSPTRFPLGRILATPGAIAAMQQANVRPSPCWCAMRTAIGVPSTRMTSSRTRSRCDAGCASSAPTSSQLATASGSSPRPIAPRRPS